MKQVLRVGVMNNFDMTETEFNALREYERDDRIIFVNSNSFTEIKPNYPSFVTLNPYLKFQEPKGDLSNVKAFRVKMWFSTDSTKGFYSTNVVFGIGSYTYQYNTRDTFGGAVKSSMAIINGVETEMFKCPKTDNGIKKSQKGCSVVFKDGSYKDQFTLEEACRHPENILEPVFGNGELLREQSLSEIRDILSRQ